MRRPLTSTTASVLVCMLACQAPSQAPQARRLQVAFVAGKGDLAAAELRTSLKNAGMRIRHVSPEHCARESWWQADVVVVVWPKGLPVGSRTPLERWDRPTVFVGDTGDRFAKYWDLPTAKQATSWFTNSGTELESKTFEGSKEWCVRQGQLVHLPKPMPTEKAAWLASTEAAVRWAAHFRSDRPMVRMVRDKQRLEVERMRVRRLHAAAVELDVDVVTMNSLLNVPVMLLGSEQEQAETLLTALFPEGPGAGANRTDWLNWMQPRKNALVWDQTSEVWHFDKLAYRRGLRGRARRTERADGLNNDPRAIAIARRVVDYHGGQALDDLATFSCWDNNLHYMWDRRRGYFRMENHAEQQPQAPAKQWRVAVMDTASGEQIVLHRHRRRTALTAFQSLVERAFMPLMLLDPGVGLRYIEAESDDETAVLAVRLCGRNMNLTTDFRLTIERMTGAILQRSRFVNGRSKLVWSVAATVSCGPLRMPATWTVEHDELKHTFTIEKVQWNPELPDDIETATKMLSLPRAK
ncbi:MAG: hypothetical protein ACI89X_003769 [Planctomycetota bacterium]|jgi:hypothetical protein